MKTYVGIDPGKTGSITVLDNDIVVHYPIPLIAGKEVDTKKLTAIFDEIISNYGNDNIICCTEDVHSIFGASAKANFQFGHIVGRLEGYLDALKIPFIKVAPQVWQKVAFLGVPEILKPLKAGQKKAQRDPKAMALVAAQRLFPKETFLATQRSSVPHNGMIDATLIAYFAKITYR